MAETIPIAKVRVVEIQSEPYLTDSGLTLHYFGSELEMMDSKEMKDKAFKKYRRRIQENVLEFDEETNGEFTRYFDGRATNLLAFDAFGAYQSYLRIFKKFSDKPYSFKDFIADKKINLKGGSL